MSKKHEFKQQSLAQINDELNRKLTTLHTKHSGSKQLVREYEQSLSIIGEQQN